MLKRSGGLRSAVPGLRSSLVDPLSSSVAGHRSTVSRRLLSVLRPPSTVHRRPSSVCRLHRVVRGRPSSVRGRPSSVVSASSVVGIIGRNGAGKGTLLKILSRITEPTEGRAGICGRASGAGDSPCGRGAGGGGWGVREEMPGEDDGTSFELEAAP